MQLSPVSAQNHEFANKTWPQYFTKLVGQIEISLSSICSAEWIRIDWSQQLCCPHILVHIDMIICYQCSRLHMMGPLHQLAKRCLYSIAHVLLLITHPAGGRRLSWRKLEVTKKVLVCERCTSEQICYNCWLRSGFSITNQIKFDFQFTDLWSTWCSELIVDQLCFVFPWISDLQLRDRRLADPPSTEPILCQSDWLTVTLICGVALNYPAYAASGCRSQ